MNSRGVFVNRRSRKRIIEKLQKNSIFIFVFELRLRNYYGNGHYYETQKGPKSCDFRVVTQVQDFSFSSDPSPCQF